MVPSHLETRHTLYTWDHHIMFHKFSLTAGKARCHIKTTEHISTSRDGLSVPRYSTKRRKISRACDRCRLQRIKCDEQKPCARCVSGKVLCIVSDVTHATQGTADAHGPEVNPMGDEPSESSEVVEMSSSLLSPSTIAAIAVDLPEHFDIPLRPFDLASDIQRLFASGFTAVEGASHTVGSLFPQLPCPAIPSGEIPFSSEPLTRDQRKRYTRIFRDLCHLQLHLLSEPEFVELEATLPPTIVEDYSVENALLDAIIALGIQHGHATGLDRRLVVPRNDCGAKSDDEIDWVGFEHFHRCRERMRANTEVTLQALRCHALMIVYLMKGYAFRDAYNMLGITVRKAYVAELQRPPPSYLPEHERTSRMQLWWLIFSLDLQCSLQLSMPAACQKSLVKCPSPIRDALERHLFPRARYGDDLTACDYSIVMIDLAMIITDIGACVSTADILDDSSNDPAVLEQLASKLAPPLRSLEDWHGHIPVPLLLDNTFWDSDSFNMNVNMFLPVWLQRQRILLELQYHNAYVLILRPFVSLCYALFTDPSGETPTVETEQSHVQRHILNALHHASAIINIAFALSSRSDVLYGWPEVLQPLWNATLVTVTYVYANSLNPGALAASQSLAHAESVFQCFSATSAAARSAKDVVQSLAQNLKDLQSLST
jgi:hypothetical protein